MLFKSWYAHPVLLIANEDWGSGYRCLTFRSEWTQNLTFLPGQYLMIDGFVGEHYLRRSYSPVNRGNGTFYLLIQTFGGLFSSVLAGLKPGSRLRMSGPTGKQKIGLDFKGPLVFIAFGSGISFPLSAVSWLKNPAGTRRVFWLNGNSTCPEEKEIRKLFPASFSLVLKADLPEVELSRIESDSLILLSGDGTGIYETESKLLRAGFHPGQIRKEIYYHHQPLR